MKNALEYPVGASSVTGPVAYTVRRYGVVKAKDVVKNDCINYEVTEPGLYEIKIDFRKNDGTLASSSGYRYFPPEPGYSFNRQQDVQDFAQEVRTAAEKSEITAFKGKTKNQCFDFIFFPARSMNLFVLCPSAITPGKTPIPYFHRWSWAAQGMFPGNVLVVSDPTFSLDSRLFTGWFFGTREQDATLYFSKVLRIVCAALQIKYRNLFFWGSSAGGFIAMQFAKYFPQSTAIAVNAQTNLFRYEHNRLFWQLMFDGLKEEEIAAGFGNRLSVVGNAKRFSDNTIFMVQNVQDRHHYQEHFLPFYSALAGAPVQELPEGIHHVPDSSHLAWVYSHPDGHMAETPEMARCILQNLPGRKQGKGAAA